jgi:hypothetical protein
MFTYDQYEQLVHEVAKLLPGHFAVETNPDSWNWGTRFLDHEHSLGIFLSLDRDHKKIAVSGVIPRDDRGQMPYIRSVDSLAKISVSTSKSAYQIARDITKRFLPVWVPQLEQMLTDIKRSSSYHSKTEGMAAEIADLVGVKADKTKVSFYRSPYPVFTDTISSAEVHGDDVTLSLQLGYEETIALLKWMTNQR